MREKKARLTETKNLIFYFNMNTVSDLQIYKRKKTYNNI